MEPSSEIAENKGPTERSQTGGRVFPEKEEDEESLEENKDIKKTNSNPTSLVITICMLKMENSEKMIVEQSSPNSSVAPKCRCNETEGASSSNTTLNNLNKSRGSHLNIICDNKNNNTNNLINNDKNEENVNLLNNFPKRSSISRRFQLKI